MSKHTPGPWFVQKGFNTIYSFYGGTSGLTTAVASPLGNQLKSGPDELDANAKLIAASPELLEALQYCVEMLENKGINGATLENAKLAIKKATT